jgi:DNA-binding transcriptional regulator YiaG
MGKVENIIKAEVLRLANREIRRVFLPLKRDVRVMKLKLSSLSKSMVSLDRVAREKLRESDSQKLQNLDFEEAKKSRFTPARIRSLRNKLGLSQRELAVATGVTLGAIGLWEKGKFSPKVDKKAILLSLRKMGKRAVKKMVREKGMGQEKKPAPTKKVVRPKVRRRKR